MLFGTEVDTYGTGVTLSIGVYTYGTHVILSIVKSAG
jgi:hypothetical protein